MQSATLLWQSKSVCPSVLVVLCLNEWTLDASPQLFLAIIFVPQCCYKILENPSAGALNTCVWENPNIQKSKMLSRLIIRAVVSAAIYAAFLSSPTLQTSSSYCSTCMFYVELSWVDDRYVILFFVPQCCYKILENPSAGALNTCVWENPNIALSRKRCEIGPMVRITNRKS